MDVALFGKRVFKDVINLRILRLLWIIQMGPKINNKYPCKRKAEKDVKQTEEQT